MIRDLIKRDNESRGVDLFRRHLDNLFDDFFSLSRRWGFEDEMMPTVDVEEDNKSIHIKAEMPGIDEKDIDVRVENDVLILSGEKKEEKKEENKNYILSERKFGSFRRIIDLPSGIKSDKIKATFKKGVLNIDIPKDEAKEPKKIAVNVQ